MVDKNSFHNVLIKLLIHCGTMWINRDLGGYEMELKIGRRKFDITDKDIVFDNGACYQVATQSYQDGWYSCSPIMSKTQFQKLIKKEALVLVKEKFAYKAGNGKDIFYKYYRFDTTKLN